MHVALAQSVFPPLPVVPAFSLTNGNELSISRQTVPIQPVSVIGPKGTLLGQQDGVYEGWIFPWKIFSGMRITANMQDYPVPIDVNAQSAWIDVEPWATTITYSHANFTVRQIMLAPKHAPEGAGALVLYQIESVRPMTLIFSFDPVVERMWPAQSEGMVSPEWVKTAGGSGFYILNLNLPGRAAAMAIPGAEPGILAPYQERAKTYPLQLVLHFDPAKDTHAFFPLLMTMGDTPEASTAEALAKSLSALDATAASLYRDNQSYYQSLLEKHMSLDTPDKSLNEAFSWAEVSIDQLRVETIDRKEQALTAGFVGSGDSARPGFGWFFGRDSLWSLYAIHSYGDFEAARQEIEFLLHRQREDGKIMHEWSQTAGLVDWKSLPYEYASADATELLLMAMHDYLKISGDVGFIREHWNALTKAWQFETSHDSDGDGIYENTEGTGWVESWVPSMPHQEIYLAALDQQASTAFAGLARAMGHEDLAQQADTRAAHIQQQIEKEYFLPDTDFYAFSRNADGTTDKTATIFPSVAWWDGTYRLNHADAMMRRWASSEFSTDWGTRLLSEKTSFYDPISYHQGTVWPLFTGWASVAEYRAGRPLTGYAHLMQNANLTWVQDLGATTELLSGQFFQVLGRSTAHQLWSSAMVISPVIRGMFGLEWDAAKHTLSVTPHLPADWGSVSLHNVPMGDNRFDLKFTRRGQELLVEATGGVRLQSRAPGARVEGGALRLPLSPVEVKMDQALPAFGSETRQMKVLDERTEAHAVKLTLAAHGGSRQTLWLRENAAGLKVRSQDAEIGPLRDGLRLITVSFPAGDGYVTKDVAIGW